MFAVRTAALILAATAAFNTILAAGAAAAAGGHGHGDERGEEEGANALGSGHLSSS